MSAVSAAWWMADRALTKAEAEVVVQRRRADDYQAAIREQNRATAVLARETAAAKARGQAALQQAAAAGQRYDAALQQLAGARVTTCADAMPFVNKVLEEVR